MLVDYTTDDPRESDPINCIIRRYDSGIGHRKKKELVYARVKFFRGNLDFESHRTDIASTILHHKGKQEGLNGWSNLGEDIVIEKDTDIDNGLPIR